MALDASEFVLGIFLVLFTFKFAFPNAGIFSFVGTLISFLAVIWLIWGGLEFAVGRGADKLLAGTAVSILMVLLFNGLTSISLAFGVIGSLVSGVLNLII